MSGPNSGIDRKVQQRGRRGFLKLLTGLGVSASAAAGLTKESLARMDVSLEEEVPYVARKSHKNKEKIPGEPIERENEYETIHRDRWKKIEAAVAAVEEVGQTIDEDFNNTKSLVVPWMTTFSDGTLGINIEYTNICKEDSNKSSDGGCDTQKEPRPNDEEKVKRPEPSFETVERRLPGKITKEVPNHAKGEGINIAKENNAFTFPISFEKKEISKLMASCGSYYDSVYQSDVPAGCKIENGTAGTPAVDDSTWEQKLVSAGHVYNGCGDKVTQPGDRLIGGPNNIAAVEKAVDDSTGDYGKASIPDDKSDLSYKWKLADDNGGYKEKTIDGIVTWDFIKNNVYDTIGDEKTFLKKQGAKTGVSKGWIEQATTVKGKRMALHTDVYKGDSGGPVFDEKQTGIYIAGINIEGDVKSYCPSTGLRAQVMEYVEHKLNVIV